MKHILLIFCFLLLSLFSFSQQTFIPHNVTRGSNTGKILLKDIDGDGDLDLLAAYYYDNLFAWYRNDGNGYFNKLNIIEESDDNLTCVFFSSDLNNDGTNDVIAGGKHSIFFYKNLGNGNFDTPQIISNNVDYVTSVFAIDLDNDSLMDIISASFYDNKIAWYKNFGNNNFGTQQIISTNSTSSEVYAIDLDNDNLIDIISALYNDNKVIWFKNLGGGNFSSEQIITNNASGAYSVMACNIDNDSLPDIIVSQALGGKYTWHKNLGNGNFTSAILINDSIIATRYFYPSDLDNDNDKDIVLTKINWYQDSLIWQENLGNGNFGPQKLISNTIDGPFSVHTGDLNGDGYNDIVAGATNASSIEIYISRGNGSFDLNQTIANAAVDVRCVFAEDLDNDGKKDILSASPLDDKIAWYQNLGNKNFSVQKVISDSCSSARLVCAANLDSDSLMDVISTSWWNNIAVHKNLGNGEFGIPQNIPGSPASINIVAKDIDSDGLKDIIGSCGDYIQWSKNLGNGNFGAIQFVYNLMYLTTFDVDDINNDGYFDIVFASNSNLTAILNDGTGSFLPAQFINQNIGAVNLQLYDLNGDNYKDILYSVHDNNTYSDYFGWYQNDGLGNFNAPVILSSLNEISYTVAASDIDNDGDLDAFVATSGSNTTTGNIHWFENLGSGNFDTIQTLASLGGWIFDIFPSDLDNDNDNDIIVAQQKYSKVIWLENTLNNIDITYNICEGESIEIDGNWYSSDTTLYDSLQNHLGGDSIVITILEVNPIPIVAIDSFPIDSIAINSAAISLPNALPAGGTFSGIGVSDTVFYPALSGTGTFWITYTYTDSLTGCSNSDSTQIIVFDVSEIENIEIDEFQIFPNPSTGEFNISGKEIQYIEIWNIAGEKIITVDCRQESDYSDNVFKPNPDYYKIDLNTNKKGIYFVKIHSLKSSKIHKLVLF